MSEAPCREGELTGGPSLWSVKGEGGEGSADGVWDYLPGLTSSERGHEFRSGPCLTVGL